MARNHMKYRCADCKHEFFAWRGEALRASRMRCDRCGSTVVDIVSKEAKRRERAGQEARDAQMRKVEAKS